MKTKMNSFLMTLILGLMLTLFACEKSEVEQIKGTSAEVEQITDNSEGGAFRDDDDDDDDDDGDNEDSAEFSYHVAQPRFNRPFDCASASNGETFCVNGGGILTVNPKSVDGCGDWVHKDADGNEIASGSWEAEKLLSWLNYGPSPLLPPNLLAGRAMIRIDLGEPADVDAILTIYCLLPEVETPPSWPEGIKINLQQGGSNFNQAIQGPTVFEDPPNEGGIPECD